MHFSSLFVLFFHDIWRRILWPSPPQKVSLEENERAHLQEARKPSHQARCRNGLVLSGEGEAVLSESGHYLGDWKTGFDLDSPLIGSLGLRR
jgi:hypothetical protein